MLSTGSLTSPGLLAPRKVYRQLKEHCRVPIDAIRHQWKFCTFAKGDPEAQRHENFWWHILGSDQKDRSGSAIAEAFKRVSTHSILHPEGQGPMCSPDLVPEMIEEMLRSLHPMGSGGRVVSPGTQQPERSRTSENFLEIEGPLGFGGSYDDWDWSTVRYDNLFGFFDNDPMCDVHDPSDDPEQVEAFSSSTQSSVPKRLSCSAPEPLAFRPFLETERRSSPTSFDADVLSPPQQNGSEGRLRPRRRIFPSDIPVMLKIKALNNDKIKMWANKIRPGKSVGRESASADSFEKPVLNGTVERCCEQEEELLVQEKREERVPQLRSNLSFSEVLKEVGAASPNTPKPPAVYGSPDYIPPSSPPPKKPLPAIPLSVKKVQVQKPRKKTSPLGSSKKTTAVHRSFEAPILLPLKGQMAPTISMNRAVTMAPEDQAIPTGSEGENPTQAGQDKTTSCLVQKCKEVVNPMPSIPERPASEARETLKQDRGAPIHGQSGINQAASGTEPIVPLRPPCRAPWEGKDAVRAEPRKVVLTSVRPPSKFDFTEPIMIQHSRRYDLPPKLELPPYPVLRSEVDNKKRQAAGMCPDAWEDCLRHSTRIKEEIARNMEGQSPVTGLFSDSTDYTRIVDAFGYFFFMHRSSKNPEAQFSDVFPPFEHGPVQPPKGPRRPGLATPTPESKVATIPFAGPIGHFRAILRRQTEQKIETEWPRLWF